MPGATLVATAVPSPYAATADALAVLVLLSEFGMLRAPLSRSQVRLYSFQSLVVTGLAAFVAADRHIPGLYAIAGISLVLKVVVIPAIVLRLLRDARVELVPSHRLGVASMVLLALVAAAFGIFVIGSMSVRSRSLPAPALGLAAAAILVSFLLVILRSDVVSQAIGFFSLENGVSVASLVVAAGLPLIVEVAFFFDLLVAVVVFGVLMRVHHERTRTLSTTVLDRLRG
ncbi:MAG: hydrogenase [Actinomycetota bacterium]|jgi:hydrogenase-4 component E|nr:hydrogenase [Actinomycetota bacterium]